MGNISSSENAISDNKMPAGSAREDDPPARSKRLLPRLLLLCAIAALIGTGCVYVVLHYRFLRNELMLRFLPPEAYISVLETEYLEGQAQKWQDALRKAFQRLAETPIHSVSLNAELNQLISSVLGEDLPFRSAALDFRYASGDAKGLLQLNASVNDIPYRAVELMADQKNGQLLTAFPELSGTALAFPLDSEFFLFRLIQNVYQLAEVFFKSVSEQFQANPYQYLLPFVRVLESVRVERNIPLPSGDPDLLTTRIHSVLSLDTALRVASEQLGEIEKKQTLSPSIVACYRVSVWSLQELAKRYPLKLHIIAYADREGNILGHEFYLADENTPLLFLSGLLFTDRTQKRSGTLVLAVPASGSGSGSPTPLPDWLPDGEAGAAWTAIPLECSQLGFDPETGYPTGKIAFNLPNLPLIGVQFSFLEQNRLPVLSASVRAAGISAIFAQLTLSEKEPLGDSLSAGYATIYPPEEWRSFLNQLNPGSLIDSFASKTQISLQRLTQLRDMLQQFLK